MLINNAGITKDGAFHKITLEQWNAVINTNLGSPFNMTRQVIEGMRARKVGRVINISWINGQKEQFGQVNYSEAKAGGIGFTKTLALENARGGITVSAICPGYISTEMVQAVPKEVLKKSILPLILVNRLGEPEEIARAVVFLSAGRGGRYHQLDALNQWQTIYGLTRDRTSADEASVVSDELDERVRDRSQINLRSFVGWGMLGTPLLVLPITTVSEHSDLGQLQ